MAGIITVSPGHDASYLWRQVGSVAKASPSRQGGAVYYLSPVEKGGEPPGRWRRDGVQTRLIGSCQAARPYRAERPKRRVFARRPDGLWLGDGIQKIHFWAVEPEGCGVLTSGWPGDPAPDRSARRDGLAAVDTPCDAGDVGGIVGQEEGYGCGDLLGSALTAKGDCGHRSGLCPPCHRGSPTSDR